MTTPGYIEASVVVPAGVTVHATNSGGGPTSVAVPAGTYVGLSAVVTALVAALNATRTPANWSGSVSLTGSAPTGKVTLNCATGVGTYTITWDSTDLRDLLGFTGNLTAIATGVASVGTKQMHGVFIPDCPPVVDGDPLSAPTRSDARSVVTPNGVVYTHVGNVHRRLRNLRYTAIALSRMWEANATTANASFETFWLETQRGQSTTSVAWFLPGSKVRIFDIQGNAFGRTLSGWYFTNAKELDEVALLAPGWTGLWSLALGDLVSDG